MSSDVEDKGPVAHAKDGGTSSSETSVAEEGHEGSRRDFLASLGKWSSAVIGLALLGSAAGSAHADHDETDAEVQGKPEGSWRCLRCRCRCRCVW